MSAQDEPEQPEAEQPFPSGHKFLISQRAAKLGWDFFYFNFYSFPALFMAGGWNLKRHLGMTAQTFYRWLDIALAVPSGSQTFELRPVEVVLIDIARYIYTGNAGPPVLRDSDAVLRPGAYAPFFPRPTVAEGLRLYTGFVGENSTPGMLAFSDFFEELDEPFRGDATRDKPPSAPESFPSYKNNALLTDGIRREVEARDGGRCFFTGRTASDRPTKLTWIVPDTVSSPAFMTPHVMRRPGAPFEPGRR
ncbi:hypothetical protein MIND_01301500 [Mycena indigotica]|uniref:Uncharacterized protein n=1 Tax=Mycena indigotica TaxID=2126181 RepID=A0A8H6VUJ7_9AGAR|nr:uncharacterized protein MIND_01301500 [Mycena indigotica]KAF7290613.1 hypothetical protein MIND_01301500 [Mycena indigotica]